MAAQSLVLAIDQGTTSTRAMLFDAAGILVGAAQRELPQIYPGPGWVEDDTERIWQDVLACVRGVLETTATQASAVAAIGIANQRETTVLWDRATGRAIHNAIVWQDRRTAEMCRRLIAGGREPDVRARTGLVIDAYFSATKIAWLLEHVRGARARAQAGDLAFGTIDSFLLWRLTGGRVHATDATNASRTLLFDIRRQEWDDELLQIFGVPAALLPGVRDSAGFFGMSDPALFGAAIPITGIAGDQQAATVGQACLEPGMVKATYGTGCFALLNTGAEPSWSDQRLLTTTAYRLDGRPTYAIEGAIFVAGAAVQWLRDGLGLVADAAETEALAASIADTGGVYLVPAFVGLGAPYWDSAARAALLGLARDSGKPQIARAALEAVAYQTRDLITAMAADAGMPSELRVDGGMVRNAWFCQFLADMLDVPVKRPAITETTALGAALLAGLAIGLHAGPADLRRTWRRERSFEPAMPRATRERLYEGWQIAVARTLTEPQALEAPR